jgi:hypothetical protein
VPATSSDRLEWHQELIDRQGRPAVLDQVESVFLAVS